MYSTVPPVRVGVVSAPPPIAVSSPVSFSVPLTVSEAVDVPKLYPAAEMPFSVNQKLFEVGIDNNLNFRPISLRHPKQRAIFAIQSAISMLFREGLSQIGFMEIHTPKLVFAGAEGGANVFKVEYFNRKLFLAQSPQFYKQMMVGVFGKVMEVGPVFRAEPHETSRHLNEYTSMDFEMGPIGGFEEIMQVETYLLRYILSLIHI